MNSPTEIRMNIAKEYASVMKHVLGKDYGGAYVFGSVARNEAKESSDVDVILVLNGEDYKKHTGVIIRKAVEFWKKYGIEVSPYWVKRDFADFDKFSKTAISKGVVI